MYLVQIMFSYITEMFPGIKHPNIMCNACYCQGISGMRYKCTVCHDFDLCYMCYHGDEHDVTHLFKRFDTATSSG